MAGRRRGLLAAGAAALALTACGFKLRGELQMPFKSIYLNLPPNSVLGAELARNLRATSDVQVLAERKGAQTVFDLLAEQREREVLAVNTDGQAREYQLRLRVIFRLVDGAGVELLPPTTLVARRDIAFNESQLLAKEQEEALLFRDMQSDLVRQMLNRLSSARPDGTAG